MFCFFHICQISPTLPLVLGGPALINPTLSNRIGGKIFQRNLISGGDNIQRDNIQRDNIQRDNIQRNSASSSGLDETSPKYGSSFAASSQVYSDEFFSRPDIIISCRRSWICKMSRLTLLSSEIKFNFLYNIISNDNFFGTILNLQNALLFYLNYMHRVTLAVVPMSLLSDAVQNHKAATNITKHLTTHIFFSIWLSL